MNLTRHLLSFHALGYYQAPTHQNIIPVPIGPGIESIELLLGGGVLFDKDDPDRECGAGTIFWHQAGEETIHRNLPERPYRCMVFTFNVRPGLHRTVPRCTLWQDAQAAQAFCWEAFNLYHGGMAQDAVFCNHVYSKLLWEAQYAAHALPETSLPASVLAAMRFVETHFQEDLQTADLAEAADLSVPHLHQLFRLHLNTSPHQYVLQRKINHACMLLASTAQPIKLLAQECGFANIETFYRVFRKFHKQTPTAYRKRHVSVP